MNAGAPRSIGEAVDLLSPEFPDITISKVRYLETQGLVVPERTGTGYRRYHDSHIAQLRWVLRLQRDQFLPLRVISERLRAGDFSADDAAEADVDGPIGIPHVDPTRPGDDTSEFTGTAIVDRSGLSADRLAELERYGLVAPKTRRGRPVYSADDLLVAQLVASFLEHGIEPRHLRPFTVAAEREGALIAQRTAVLDDAEAPATLRSLVRLGGDLRALLLRRHLHA